MGRIKWEEFSAVERGALLLDLAATLRLWLEEQKLDQSLISECTAFAAAAQKAGQALLDRSDLPFDPDPPFRWSKMTPEEVIQVVMHYGPISPIDIC